MDSGMISKIQKSKHYAEEPDRVSFDSFSVTFRGEHSNYTVTYEHGKWGCQCSFFHQRGVCSHTMAMERLLGVMLQRTHAETEPEKAS
jgi:hypothetical protein